MAQSSDTAPLPPRLQPQYPQRLRHDDSLLLVIWWWDTLKDLEALHGRGTALRLVWYHASDGLVEDSGGGPVVERTCMPQ